MEKRKNFKVISNEFTLETSSVDILKKTCFNIRVPFTVITKKTKYGNGTLDFLVRAFSENADRDLIEAVFLAGDPNALVEKFVKTKDTRLKSGRPNKVLFPNE